MFISRGLKWYWGKIISPETKSKWYWGKIISPETKSRDLYSSRNIISNPKILGTFRDVPDNKVAICYIVWLPIAPIALPGFGIARRNLQNSVFFSAGILFKLYAVQCVSSTVRRSATRIHCTVRAIKSQCAARTVNIHVWSDSIASSVCHLFAWKNVWYRSMFLLRSSGEGNILKCLSITWLCLANRCLILD